MKKTKRDLTRRDFLTQTTGAAVVSAIGCKSTDKSPPRPTVAAKPETKTQVSDKGLSASTRSTVVLVRDEHVLDSNRVANPKILSRMLDDGVVHLLDAPTPEDAWGSLVKPTDTVGIKSNVWRFLPTPPALEEALRQRVIDAGVPASSIDVADRGILGNPVFQKATALINVRPLRTHHWAGVGSCIKNYIMFSDSPSSWHDDSCANLAGVWDLPAVKGKTRLNILVMLTPLFQGKGPHHYQAKYTWPYNGLIIGTDPVAVDATGVRILEAQRKVHFGTTQPFSVPPKHIKVAEDKYRLGIADPKRIDVIKLGWNKDVLI
ncbi:MAG: DUF362 domain-containing protein [Deltaproteobacteria bacterium]|nr:DUF362 domain-containing protein [Deltaproteobacteria bacterium]